MKRGNCASARERGGRYGAQSVNSAPESGGSTRLTEPPDASTRVPVSASRSVLARTSLPASGQVFWGSMGGCTEANDLGLQQLRIRVTATRGEQVITETVTVVKRDARCNYSPDYENADQGPC